MKKITFFKQVSEIDAGQWSALVMASSVASFFQTKDCCDFYDSLPFLEAFVFGVQENDALKGVVVGYIQKDGGKVKRFFSRRAIINGGPLLADDISEEAVGALLKGSANILRKKAIYIETRNFNDYSRWKTVFIECRFLYEPHYNFQVDTSSVGLAEQNVGKSRKRDIRTSLRDGATVVDDPNEKEVKELYELLSELYRKKVKTPLFPYAFFKRLYESDFGRFILVRYNDCIIGGTVCVCLNNKVMYEWFACGKDGQFKNIYPSTLATWSGILYAANHGFKCFDMMGAGKPGDGGYGVRDFKAKFGGQLVEHGRFLFICDRLLFEIGSIGVKILKGK